MSERMKLKNLLLAVLKNTGRPTVKEMEKIKVEKKILTSPKFEGDSKIGMILFCGMAKLQEISDDEVMDFLCIEGAPELEYKLKEFSKLMAEDREFQVKIKLVNNYLNLL
jgi:hypothetical protein